ncbi:hypothetical protein HAX54_038881 [Datura stramonium]|uniref:Uncharacterized protein n=1 Tax=Datura stramonium TaxID=4076 RepID=A0ABS8VKD3_DATST|nr:hypothetical protein [Datura stramonium]
MGSVGSRNRLHTLGLGFVFDAPSDCNLNMVREFLANCMPKERHDIEEEEVDYRPTYDPRGIDVAKIKEIEGINSSVLFVNTRNARIGNMLSHLYRPGFEVPFDDDVAIEDEMARVDSDIKCSDDNEKNSEMGEAALTPTDDEE